MGIEPEKVLVNHHIASQSWIEKSGVGNDVKTQQDQGSR